MLFSVKGYARGHVVQERFSLLGSENGTAEGVEMMVARALVLGSIMLYRLTLIATHKEKNVPKDTV